MSSWRDEFLAAAREKERNNPVNLEIVELCSHLSDRVASLEAEKELLTSGNSPKAAAAPSSKGAANTDESIDPAGYTELKYQLAEALRSQSNLQTRVRKAEDEAADLRGKTKASAKAVKELTAENARIATKLKDREHELREKRKLVADVQDEMIALNLQLDMAEKERAKVKKENKELVDRWMARMGEEAEAMNLANER